MAGDKSPWEAIDRQLEGEPVVVGETSIRLIGRLTGKRFSVHGTQGGGTGIIATLQPQEIIVSERGNEHSISLEAQQEAPARAILLAGVAASAGCLAIMLMSRLVARNIAQRAMKPAQGE